MQQQHGNSCTSSRKICEWIGSFKSDQIFPCAKQWKVWSPASKNLKEKLQKTFLQDLCSELLNHSPHRPDLVQIDFYLFVLLNEELCRKYVSLGKKIIEAVRNWTCTSPKFSSPRNSIASLLRDTLSS